LKPLCITTSEPYPNPDLPTDSGEEAKNLKRKQIKWDLRHVNMLRDGL